MSLIDICTTLALDVGLPVPDVVVTSPDRAWGEALSMANAAADELARRVDWGALHKAVTLTGDGTNKVHDLGDDFARITAGVAVTYQGGIVRPLTQAEWASLGPVEGFPRYFLLEGGKVTLWPFLTTGETAVAQIQSSYWSSAGGAEWMADTDTALIDEDLIAKGLIVRWRRQKGMAMDDQEAEYEAALQDVARFDDRGRF